MKGIDCYGPLTVQQLSSLKANGVTHVGRYLGYKSRGWSKGMTMAEARLITQSGFKVLSLFEGLAIRSSYFSYAQGVLDAQSAVQDAQYVGQPSGTAIFFAVDFDAQDSDMDAIRKYFDGVRSAIGQYKVGVYGSYRVVNNVSADYYWQTVAWSYGQLSTRANVYQSKDDTAVSGISVDFDDVKSADCGAWPAPAPKYVSMNVLVNGKPFAAIAVNDVTYVLWTALNVFGTPHVYKGNGLMCVNGVDVQGVVYGGDTYLPWSCLAKGIQATKANIQWNFVVPN